MNGDGLPDRVVKKDWDGQFLIWFNKCGAAGKLKKIINPQGGAVEYGYSPIDKRVNPQCKSPMWVATSVKVSDGKGNTEETTYEYSDGVYDPLEREFRGFGLVKVTSPTLERTETEYHTIPYYNGLPKQSRTYNYENKLFDETEFVYGSPVFTAYTVSGYNEQVRFIPLKKKIHKTYDGAEDCLEVITEYKYDSFGNVTETVVSESYNNDKRIVYNWYNIDRDKWNLRQLKETILVRIGTSDCRTARIIPTTTMGTWKSSINGRKTVSPPIRWGATGASADPATPTRGG
jgi:hypothetical protein